jgi:hypothetical protein
MMNHSVYTIIYFLIVLFFLFFVLSKIKEPNKESNKKELSRIVNILYRQAARWSAASIQDKSTIIKVLHANYGAGYLWALKDIVSTEDFRKITGQDFLTFEKEIVHIQDASTKELINECKSLVFAENPVLFKAMYSS